MKAFQYKNLLKTGLGEKAIEILDGVFQSKEESLANKQGLIHAEATVGQELKTTDIKLQTEMKETKLIFFFLPIYIALIIPNRKKSY